MKTTLTLFIMALLMACNTNNSTNSDETIGAAFFVGTYTDGDSQGIYKYLLNTDGTLAKIGLATKAHNPSFLAWSADKKYLVAVSEIADANDLGSLESYAVDGDSLLVLSRSASGGKHPCFVAVNDRGYVLAANYTGGNVGLLQLNSKGELSELLDVEQHSGKGTTDRQKGPHAHSAWFSPDGSGLISLDLGTNELWFARIDTNTQKLIPATPQKLAMAEGAGPRHLAFHPMKPWIYVLNELNNTVTLIKKNTKGIYAIASSIPTLPDDFTEFSKAADIHISSNGEFLYASNRGHNSIAIFRANPRNGSLHLLAHEPTRGEEPRNFTFSPRENYLLVANQNSHTIVSFRRNKTTGLLTFIDEIAAPKPVCLLFE